jgi:ferredoxin
MALTQRLRVDPIACDGHGLCAQLLPERISLDDWGYPIVEQTPIGPHLAAHARRAVNACPVLALKLEVSPDARQEPPRRSRRRTASAVGVRQ